MNSVFCRLLGYTEHELNNKTIEELIHSEGVTDFKNLANQALARQNAVSEIHQDWVTRNGDTVPVSLTLNWLNVVGDANQNSQINLILRNQSQENLQETEHQRTQWFLQKTFDTIDQGVTIYDSDFRLVAWNKRYESFEIFPPEFLQRGTYLADAYEAIAKLGVFGPGDPEEHAKEHIQSLINRKVKPVEELKSLKNRRIEIRRYLMPEGGLVAVFSDITEQRAAEAQLRKSQKMEAVGQLTGGIAHDFNNILNIIFGCLYLFESSIIRDDKANEHLEMMRNTCQRAADLTSQLLAFSRTEPTSKKSVNVNRMVDNLRGLMVHSLTPQITLNHNFGKELWLTEIDPGDFEDALLNMTLNARDAMSGRGQLTISTNNSILDTSFCSVNPGAKPGEYVQLTVSDTGTGIASAQQERIFEPFFTTKDKGTGLGLAMVFGFVKRSQGYIKLSSEPDVGATFQIYLPRIKKPEHPGDETDRQHEDLQSGSEVLLIVDDEIDLTRIAKESLQALGYKVLTANNGEQALQILTDTPTVDLLFSDLVMPGAINGYELAEQAINLNPSLKILLTSGYTEGIAAKDSHDRFKSNLINKPYTQVVLAQTIRNLLDKQATA